MKTKMFAKNQSPKEQKLSELSKILVSLKKKIKIYSIIRMLYKHFRSLANFEAIRPNGQEYHSIELYCQKLFELIKSDPPE